MTYLGLFHRLLLWLYFPFVLLLCLGLAGLLGLLIVRYLDSCPLLLLLLVVVLLGSPLAHVGLALLRVLGRLSGDNGLELALPRSLVLPLYELVWQVARDHKLLPPDDIRLAADTVAHVYEDGKGHRVLVIGAVALATFSQEALAGIVAHALAHFTAGDTRLLRRRLRVAVCMALLDCEFERRPLSKLNPLVWLLCGYHLLYRLTAAAHSREQEYAADRYEVAQVSKETAAASLILLTVTERLPWARLSTIVEQYAAGGQVAGQIFAEQVRRARTTSPSEWQDALRRELNRPTGSFDSHPALKERLAAMGVSPRKALRLVLDQSGPPAHELIPAWEEVEKLLAESLIEPYREYYLLKRDMAQVMLGRPLARP